MEQISVINWCRVFTLEDGDQLLVTKDFNDDKFLIRIEARFEAEGMYISPVIKLTYTCEKTRNSVFDEMESENAYKSFCALKKEAEGLLSTKEF